MLFTLLLAYSATPLAAQTAQTAADFFPADTMAVIEFSLEPWDRLREQTIAFDILSEGKILRTAANELQKQLAIESSLPKGFDLRALASSTRFYMGFAGESLPWGSVIMGFDNVSLGAATMDPKLLLDALDIPWRQVGRSVIAIAAIPGTSVLNEMQVGHILDQLEARAKGKVDAPMLGDTSAWKEMRGMLKSPNRMFGAWILGDNWTKAGVLHWLPPELRDDPEVENIMWPIIEATVKGFELDQIRGSAVSMEVAPPFIQDRMILLGGGLVSDIMGSAPPEGTIFDRLAQCSSGGGQAGVAQFLIVPYLEAIVGTIETMLPLFPMEFGLTEEYEQTFKPMIAQVIRVAAQLGPQTVTEMSLEANRLGQFDHFSIQVKDRAALDAAWQDVDEQVKSIIPLILMSVGASEQHFQLSDDSFTYNRPEAMDHDGTLGETPEFKDFVKRMKSISAGQRVLGASYISSEGQAIILEQFLFLLQMGADQVNYELGPGFAKLSRRKNLAKRMHPGGMVTSRFEGGVMVQGYSVFGSSFAGGVLAVAQSMKEQGFGGPTSSLDEEEF